MTSKVSVWYSEHSTPNPLGVVPPHTVRIISNDKFAAALASLTVTSPSGRPYQSGLGVSSPADNE